MGGGWLNGGLWFGGDWGGQGGCGGAWRESV